MTVCRIKTRFDHLEAASMTGIKNDLGVVGGTDLDTSTGGGLRHGRRGGRGGRSRGKEKKTSLHK